MIIPTRPTSRWHLFLVLLFLLLVSVGPSRGWEPEEFEFTTDIKEVQIGKPLTIRWKGVEDGAHVIVDLSSTVADLRLVLYDTAQSDLSSREYVWTPDETQFPKELLENPDGTCYIVLVKGFGDDSNAIITTPFLPIRPRAPEDVSGSPVQLTTGMKIGIGVGVGILALILIAIAGWVYTRTGHRRIRRDAAAAGRAARPIVEAGLRSARSGLQGSNMAGELPNHGIPPDDYMNYRRRLRPYSLPPSPSPGGSGALGPSRRPQSMQPRSLTAPILLVSDPEGRPISPEAPPANRLVSEPEGSPNTAGALRTCILARADAATLPRHLTSTWAEMIIITSQPWTTWRLGLVLIFMLLLAVGPVFAQLRFTSTTYNDIQLGKPFGITWDGIDVDTRLYIYLMTYGGDFDTRPGLATSQLVYLWTPVESQFPDNVLDEVLHDDNFLFYLELYGVGSDGQPDRDVAYAKSPDFVIHPRERHAPTTTDQTTSAAPTSSATSASTPTSTQTDSSLPPADGQLSNPKKIGIGIGAAIGGLIVITLFGWLYGRSLRGKQNGKPPGATMLSPSAVLGAQQHGPTTTNTATELPSPIQTPSPGVPANGYTDRRYRPYSVPPDFNSQQSPANLNLQGAPHGPPSPGPFMKQRHSTVPAILVASEHDGQTMNTGPSHASHGDIPASLVPGGAQNRAGSWPWRPLNLPYPTD
ncbi:hypothetical protein V8F20_010918 [Naviculisporaceae sp. PSN 640]